MLGNKKGSLGAGGNTTLISRDTIVVGDIHFGGSLDIEGVVQGNVIAEEGADALVRVIDKGRIEGEIRAPSVIVNGTVEGDIYASVHLELAARGRVQGNVHYALLEMAAGSEVNGSLTHTVAATNDREKPLDHSVEVTEVPSGVAPIDELVAAAKVD